MVLLIDKLIGKIILGDMKYPESLRKALVVMNSSADTRPEFVASVLGKYDRKVEVRDRWASAADSHSNKKHWCGALALFGCAAKAKLAARELRMSTRSIKTIMFPDFLDVVMATEVGQYSVYKNNTCVVVRGRRSTFTNSHVSHLSGILEWFGTVKRIEFVECGSDYGIICEVAYGYTTHALAAVTILNGLCYSGVGHIHAELKQTRNAKKLMEYLEGIMVEYFNNEDPNPIPDCCPDCEIQLLDNATARWNCKM